MAKRLGLEPLLAPFGEVGKGLYKHVSQWRASTGRKVIGCIPMYTPEEIVHAAGMLPVTLLGGNETITLADKYVQPYLSCGMMRSNLDMALKGKLDFLDGAIFPDICEPTQMIADIWRLHVSLPFHHSFMIPLVLNSPRVGPYLVSEYERLKIALERFGGEITEASLRRSIGIYNENRRLLTRLYDLRRQPSFPLQASEVANVVLASMLMPKEEHSRLLGGLLAALEADGSAISAGNKARILLTGYTCDRPENDVLDFVEGLNATVVDDDLYVGRRYFHGQTSENVAPLVALAERHLAGLPCITKHTEASWADQVVKMAVDAKADGVLVAPLKYCDPLAFEYPNLKKRLDAENIPHLMFEVEERGSGTAQVRNRLQAFVELVLERKESN